MGGSVTGRSDEPSHETYENMQRQFRWVALFSRAVTMELHKTISLNDEILLLSPRSKNSIHWHLPINQALDIYGVQVFKIVINSKRTHPSRLRKTALQRYFMPFNCLQDSLFGNSPRYSLELTRFYYIYRLYVTLPLQLQRAYISKSLLNLEI